MVKIDEIEFAYLFGSYAHNNQIQRSDIDLIILNNAKNFTFLEDIFNESIVLQEFQADKIYQGALLHYLYLEYIRKSL